MVVGYAILSPPSASRTIWETISRGRFARYGPARRWFRARVHPGPPAARTRARPGGGRHAASHDLPLQVARFTVIGVASTIAYVVLFLMLHWIMSAQAANVASLLVTAVANTAANRRLTFGISGRSGNAAGHQVKGLIAFGIGLTLTSGALAVLTPARPIPAG